MAVFDIRTYLALTGRGSNGILALGSAFGMPQCMLNLGADILSLMPSPILSELEDSAMDGREAADEVIKKIVKWTLGQTGIIEYDTEQGVFRFVSDTSKYGNDRDEGSFLGKSLAFLNAAAQFGGRLYENYQSTTAQINSIIECFGTYKTYLDYTGGNSANRKEELATTNPDAFQRLFEAEYETNRRRLREAADFIDRSDAFIDNIREIIRAREEDPSLEPIFNRDAEELLKNTGFRIGQSEPDQPEEIIRLVYGPPKSKKGQFLLSVDGLYYDSQTSGLSKVLSFINVSTSSLSPEHKWKFDYDPNLGGKGVAISTSKFQDYTNTVFDPNTIDNSEFLQIYYKADHFLQQLEGQKNKRISDINKQVKHLEDDSTAPEAIILNLKQSLYSEAAYHDDKIKRRKKQIEVAVKAPSIYGNTAMFSPGNVPINDFSYLQNFNFSMDLGKQKKLILDQDEVSGVVAPIIPKFVVSVSNDNAANFPYLLVPPIGAGGIIYDGVSPSSTDPIILDLSDQISTNGLFAVYNYLETNVETASSTNFLLTNCAVTSNTNYAQLVSNDPDTLFQKGIGIAYLDGIVKYDSDLVTPSSHGNYVRLPDSTQFSDWLYKTEGATFETWIHIPGLKSWEKWGNNDSSALYRLILSCENVGINQGTTAQSYSNDINPSFGTSYTRGLIIGFTRDARFTQSRSPTNSHYDQDPMDGVSFVIAPTQSISVSEAVFTRRIPDDGSCDSSNLDFHSFTVNTSSYTTDSLWRLNDLANEFGLLDVVFSPQTDTLSVYLNGSLLATSSLSHVFGTPLYTPPRLPNFKKANSHNYINTNYGPPLGKYFTPWILGGGYTDGYENGNFMGGSYGGIKSGLHGFLGSTKFYQKALTREQIVNNYNIQGGFFGNILTYINDWDPINMGSWGP